MNVHKIKLDAVILMQILFVCSVFLPKLHLKYRFKNTCPFTKKDDGLTFKYDWVSNFLKIHVNELLELADSDVIFTKTNALTPNFSCKYVLKSFTIKSPSVIESPK